MVVAASAITMVYITFFTLAPLAALRTKKYLKMINLSSQLLIKRHAESGLQLDSNQEFLEQFDEIKNHKFANDPDNKFYFLKKDYKPPTSVEIPLYFFDVGMSKPIVQPFDARFTLAVYLAWITANPNTPAPFHWSDWINLLDLNTYILLPSDLKPSCNELFDVSSYKDLISDSTILKVSDYCIDDKAFPLGFKVTKFPEAQTRENAKLLAKLHVYLSFPSPAKLVFLSNSKGSYHVDVKSRANDLRNSLLQNGMVEQLYAMSKSNSIDVLDSFKALLKNGIPNVPQPPLQPVIDLLPEWFETYPNIIIDELKKQKRNLMDQNYLESLQFSLNTQLPAKYFNEAKLLNTDGSRLLGDHHDWRFFNGLTIHSDLQVVVLHRLLKNYLQFCRLHGLITWIAHGSLLLWYWNGISFPWDSDSDTQMPIRDLNRLGREFNQTLVIENVGYDYVDANVADVEFNGMGVYFVDVGNSITHRSKGNGNNNIDARFIDIHTGLYVDITGLSVSEEQAPARYDYFFELKPNRKKIAENAGIETARNIRKKTYNCRNRHFSSLDELSPLVMTSVQNQVGYVPKHFEMTLFNEYSIDGLIQNNFESSYYLPSIRVWAQTDTLVSYFENKEQWVKDQKGTGTRLTREATLSEKEQIMNFKADDFAKLLNSEWILREYLVSKDFTLFHEQNIELLLRNNMDKYKRNMKEYFVGQKANKAMWGDVFMSKVAVDGWNYEAEKASLRALIEMHENDLDSIVQKFQIEEKKKIDSWKKQDDELKKKKEEEEKEKEEEEKKNEEAKEEEEK